MFQITEVKQSDCCTVAMLHVLREQNKLSIWVGMCALHVRVALTEGISTCKTTIAFNTPIGLYCETMIRDALQKPEYIP